MSEAEASLPLAGPAAAGAGATEGPVAVSPPAVKPGRKYDRSLIEGPLRQAVWRLAWPTMLQNTIGAAQGMVDQVVVGRYVGFTGNAAIGVSLQIFLVVIVFISSLFTGMSVLVARFAGAGESDKVDLTVYNAFVLAIALSVGVFAPIGYFGSPYLLKLVNAAPEVQAIALPYLRIMFGFSFGMLIFFMLGGALRSAGDSRTPLMIGGTVTVLNIVLNVVLIRGFGPIPAFGAKGSAMGTCTAMGLVALYAFWRLVHGGWVVAFPKKGQRKLDFAVIKALFKFGLPTGIQGIAMNLGGMMLLSFIGSLEQSAASQAAYAISYGELFSLITIMSQGLLGAASATAGQNLGAKNPHRAEEAVHVAAKIGVIVSIVIGLAFLFIPRQLLAVFGMHDPVAVAIGVQLLRVLSVSGLFITVALTYTGGLQGTGDTKSPLYISIVSQIIVPLGICAVIKGTSHLDAVDIWIAILIGHMTRCALSVIRFNQGKWRAIAVDIGH